MIHRIRETDPYRPGLNVIWADGVTDYLHAAYYQPDWGSIRFTIHIAPTQDADQVWFDLWDLRGGREDRLAQQRLMLVPRRPAEPVWIDG